MSGLDVRSLAMISPKGSGKTSLVEAILFNAKITTRIGRVEDGNTVSDHDPEEIERKMSLFPTVNTISWNKHTVHLLDSAGYPDFLGETRFMLKAVDNVVMLVSANDGVKSQASRIWSYLDEEKLPRFIFVTEMDKEHADFDAAWDSIRQSFESAAFAPLTIPMVSNKKLTGVIDLVKMKACAYKDDGTFAEGDIPAEFADMAAKYRERLVETVAEVDDTLTEKFLDGVELTAEEIAVGLRKGVVSAQLVPVFAGSATRNVGVAQLMDTFITLSATAQERGDRVGVGKDGAEVIRKPHENEPFSAIVFKTVVDQFAGKISMFRVVSGVVKSESAIYNSTNERKEKITQIFHICNKKQTPVPQAGPGDIAIVVKLQETSTGDTFCDQQNIVRFPAHAFPEPVISFAIQPKERGDEDKMSLGLGRLMEEDPLLRTRRDAQTHQLTIAGMGQLHLEATVSRLRRKFAIELNVSTPEVPYRETITQSVKVQGKHKKQSGGRGQYGDVWLELIPQARDEGYVFENKIFGGSVPRNYIPAVEKGVIERMKKGVIAGYPLVDMKVVIFDGSYHDVDSSDMAFKIAASLALQKGVPDAKPVLLEPVMMAEIEVPDESIGDIIGDINGRRGRVITVDQGNKVKIVKASVPLAEMLRYAPDLRSITSGQGSYTMELDHFEEVPRKVADEIIERYKKRKAEEEEE